MKDLSLLYSLRNDARAVDGEMAAQRGRFDRLKREKTRTITAFNLFQTPESIADRMARTLMHRISSESVVLEPSAGLGRLYRAMRGNLFNGRMLLIENAPQCMRELYDITSGDNVKLIQRDFLEVESLRFDGTIMNPPFKNGIDIKHILHALSMLNNGGRLVGLCYNGPRQNKKIKPLSIIWEELPIGSFKGSGTNANVCFFVIDK